MRKMLLVWMVVCYSVFMAFGQENHAPATDHTEHTGNEEHAEHAGHDEHGEHAGQGEHGDCGCHGHHDEFNPSATAFHHIADANHFQFFGDLFVPLPVIAYTKGEGLSTFMSSKFKPEGHHGDGTQAVNGYVLFQGTVMHVKDAGFPKTGTVPVDCFKTEHGKDAKGKETDILKVIYQGQCYTLEKKSTMDGGLLGGGMTSFIDFSITKNVFTMLLVFLLLGLAFRSVVKAYTKREGKAPTGLQNLVEPIFLFVRDEVAIPFLGAKYERYLPYLMSIFFFILGLNLVGQIPLFPFGGNVTGNLSVTMVLAIITFLVVNISGNRHYWEHTLWMPGVPVFVKPILSVVEIMGLFIKPLTLMLRLFANITAGHIVIVIFISLIFIFGNVGQSISGSITGTAISIPLTMFMMAIELIVAFVQAFVFTILTASYISAAVEDHHHAEEHH